MTVNRGESAGGPEIFREDSSFRFDCHPGLACFGKCCRDINIFLTPYDVIRLRRRLGISSSRFLSDYTGEINVPGMKFPLVYLKMKEEEDLKCSFVTPEGCSVYEDRPWSCRMAPVDIAGPGLYRFAFDREKCHGLDEDREWTVGGWMQGQDMGLYDEVEGLFKDIPALVRLMGDELPDRTIVRLFRMVCYDLDNFRDFVLRSKFLIREGGLDPELFRELAGDDARLLDAGIRWLINVSGSVQTLKKISKLLS